MQITRKTLSANIYEVITSDIIAGLYINLFR